MSKSDGLRSLLLKSAQGFMIQTAHTALANGRAKLEQRLARWLSDGARPHDQGRGAADP